MIEIEKTDKILDELLKNFPPDNDLEDLKQDLILMFLENPPKGYSTITDEREMKYYLSRLLVNNIFSKTSRYYYTYKKHLNNQIPIEEINEN